MATKAQALKVAKILYGKDAFAEQAKCSLWTYNSKGDNKVTVTSNINPKTGKTHCTGGHAAGTCPGNKPYYQIGVWDKTAIRLLGVAIQSIRVMGPSWEEVIARAKAQDEADARTYNRKPKLEGVIA